MIDEEVAEGDEYWREAIDEGIDERIAEKYGYWVDEGGKKQYILTKNYLVFINQYVATGTGIDTYAIKAIREIAELGYPIPRILLPWLNKACDALVDQCGNVITNYETDEVWQSRIKDTHRLVLGGYKPKEAFDAIADRDSVKSSSVKTHYYRDHAEERRFVEKEFAELKEMMAEIGDDAYLFFPSTDPETILGKRCRKPQG